jgi:hypothetical protein
VLLIFISSGEKNGINRITILHCFRVAFLISMIGYYGKILLLLC